MSGESPPENLKHQQARGSPDGVNLQMDLPLFRWGMPKKTQNGLVLIGISALFWGVCFPSKRKTPWVRSGEACWWIVATRPRRGSVVHRPKMWRSTDPEIVPKCSKILWESYHLHDRKLTWIPKNSYTYVYLRKEIHLKNHHLWYLY